MKNSKSNTSSSKPVPNLPSKVIGHPSGSKRDNYPPKVPERPMSVTKPVKKGS